MNLDINVKKNVEDKLRNYPYYLISVETPGLGQAIRPDKIIDKNSNYIDLVGKQVSDIEYKENIIKVIEFVYDNLDSITKKIIEYTYYRDDMQVNEIIEKLNIGKNQYYRLKNRALVKFACAFGYQ